jgi:hypothetical protein
MDIYKLLSDVVSSTLSGLIVAAVLATLRRLVPLSSGQQTIQNDIASGDAAVAVAPARVEVGTGPSTPKTLDSAPLRIQKVSLRDFIVVLVGSLIASLPLTIAHAHLIKSLTQMLGQSLQFYQVLLMVSAAFWPLVVMHAVMTTSPEGKVKKRVGESVVVVWGVLWAEIALLTIAGILIASLFNLTDNNIRTCVGYVCIIVFYVMFMPLSIYHLYHLNGRDKLASPEPSTGQQ